MKQIVLNLILLCFCCELVHSQTVFDPNDAIVNYNSAAALGTPSHPAIPYNNQIVKWVRTPKTTTPAVTWNTSRYKCYMVNSVAFRLRYPNGYVPGANDGKKFPIMIFWHGGGETNANVYDNEYQLYQGAQTFERKTVSDQDAFIIFPQSSIVGFDNGHYTLMNIVIDSLIKNCKGDEDRIISMGLSIGGINSLQYAVGYPQRVSSIIGSSPIQINSYASAAAMGGAFQIPLWIANGGKDTGPDSTTVQTFLDGYQRDGGVLQQTYFPLQGHVLWDYQWALEPTFDSAWSTAHKANPLVYGNNRFFCPGSPVSARMGLTPGFYAYQWDKDGSGVPIPGATGSDYTATALGSYRARFQRTATSNWSAWSLAPAKITAVCPPLTGNGTGLLGSYYNSLDLTSLANTRVDPSMNFYIENNASPISGVNGGAYSVRWTGKIQAQFTETYTITTLSDDGVRMWINGVQLVNNWTDHGGTENSGSFAFVAGQKYDIKIEYYNKSNYQNIYNDINSYNTGIFGLKWSSPSTVKQMVPKTQLYPDGTGDPTVPVCVTNTSPVNAATLATGTTATLTWNGTNATTYDLYLYTGASVPGSPTVTGITSNSYNATGLLGSTSYNWFVVPKNAAGSPSGCAANKTTFTTAGAAVPVPGCTVNSSPANGTTIASQTKATFTWAAAANATSYDLYVWTGAVAPVTPTGNVTGTSYDTLGLSAGTTYKFYLAPRNASGAASGCAASNTTTFSTASVPVVPFPLPNCVTNTAPANNATLGTATTATLSWNSGVSTIKKLVIIGSSTSACVGLDSATQCYVGRLGSFYNQTAPQDTVATSLAIPGTNVYNGMPSSYVTPYPGNGNYFAPRAGFNITAALALNPDAVLVNYPSNSYDTLSVGEIMYCLRTIRDSANKKGVPCFITTTQPRTSGPDFFTSAVKLKLAILKDSILAQFGNYAIDFYTGLINPSDSSILYDQGDQTHMNATGHSILAQRVEAKNVFSPTLNPSAVTSYDLYMWTGATPPGSPTRNVNTTTIDTTGLTAGTTYKFYVAPRSTSGAATGCATTNTTAFTTAAIPVPACVVNTAPVNGTVLGTQTTATLTWPSSATAVSYDVYLWTGATPPASPTANVSTTSYSATALTAGSVYNWYIAPRNASGANATCAATNTTSFTTAAIAPPACVINTAPANGTILGTQTTATLTWPSSPTATSYDVYLWTGATPPASPTVNVTTTSYNATALTAGTLYNWYISPRNAGGANTTCGSTNATVFTTASVVVPVPSCVVNTSPANAVVLGTQTTATLTWPSAATATSYDVYLWTGATPPASPTVNVTTTSYNATGLTAGTLYNWYIAPRNASGPNTTCAASNTTTFTTASIPAPACVINTSPANAAVLGTQTTATLTWPSAATATSYDVYLWTGATPPASPTVNVTTTSYSISTLNPGTLYNWYIAPRNASGANATCAAANTTTFSTATSVTLPPGCAVNNTPANNATVAAQNTATLTWGTVTTATSYDVYIWTGATPPSVPTTNVATTSYNATALLPSTVYSWYIAPRNAGGAATGCGTTGATSFTTAAIPCVVNTSPANAAVLGTQTTATLTWPSEPTATSYDVYLWTGATPPASPTANVTTTSYNATSLLPNTQYNWYIAPRNAGGAAGTCRATNTTTFTTAAIPVPACVVNTAPVNGTVLGTQTTATLTWPSSATAVSYDVYLWTGATPPASPTANVSTTSYSATALTAGSVYNWYIAPRNASGANATCAATNTTSFTTAAIAPPACVINTAPANGTILGTQTTATLTWPSSPTATSYDVYLWTGATPPASPTVNVTTTSYNATALTAGTLYNWYISPRNAGGANTTCGSTNATVFTTASVAVPVPACVVNTAPANGTTLATQTTATLTWPSAATATSYDVYLWTGATAPSTPTANTTALTYSVTGLIANTIYNWYIAPKNASGANTACATTNKTAFTTAAVSTPGTGLQGDYFNGTALAGTPLLTRIDPTVNFVLTWMSPAPGIVPQDAFSVRWTGQVKPLFSETYTFYTQADDGIRLWINGVQLVDNWVNQGTTEKSGTITLVAGQLYDVKIEYYESAGDATASFLWSSASTPKAIVPQAQLYPPGFVAPTAPNCAINTAPVTGSTVATPTSATLTWSTVSNATSYDVYVWTGATAPSVPTTNVTTTTYNATGLTASTTYNWYVVPKNATGAATGCSTNNLSTFITAPPPPACATGLVPANATVLTTVNTATLTWSATPGATSYDVYLWTGATPPSTPTANTTSFSYSATALTASATYNWYIAPRNASGPATGCTPITFVTAAPPPPLCTTNVSPANATVIATGNTAALTWNAATNATSYDVYVWTGATAPSVPTTNVTTTSYTATGLSLSTAYSWYIAPRNTSGAATGCATANTSTFTTAAVAVPVPACVINTAPANGTTLATQTTATLTWPSAATATSYDVYLWTGATAPSTPTANTTALTYSVTGLIANTIYNWYIAPKNASGANTACATTNKTAFTTAAVSTPGTGLQGDYFNGTALAGTPLLTRIDPTVNFVLTWMSPAPGIVPQDAFSVRWTGQVKPLFSETYTFYTQADDGIRLWINGVQLVDNWVNQGTTEKSGTITLVAGQLYDVKIEYYDNAGDATASFLWSSASTPKAIVPQAQLYPPGFVAPTAPNCAINTAPVTGSTVATPTSATLTWSTVSNATSYDVYVWTGATAPSVPTTNVTTTTYNATGLTASTTYNWYVVPKNATGAATGCSTNNLSTFITATPPPPPLCTTNVSPANATVIATGNTAALTWNAATNATSYDVYVWTGATAPSVPTTNVTTTSYTATGLSLSTAYSWYIAPRNTSGAATGCATANTSTFTTAAVAVPVPACVINTAPANGTTLATQTTATLTWPSAATATSYDVYLWTGATAPSTPTANTTALTYSVTGLIANTIYNWYIAPKNASGANTACATTNKTAFTTAAVSTPGTGLQGDYFNGTALAGTPLLTRIDPTVNFVLTWMSPAPGIVPQDAFSVRWTGQVKPLFSETYTFYTQADDGIRLWINGVQLVDNWVNQGTTEKSGTITLVAGQLYDVKIEYYESAGDATASFLWSSASTPKAIVPQAQLYPPGGGGGGALVANAGLRTTDTTAAISPAQAMASVTSSVPTLSSSVSPNPVAAGQTIKVRITSDKSGTAVINIININGLIINTQKINLVAGVNTVTVNTSSLGQGIYIVNLTGGTSPVNMKLLVQ